MNPLRSLGLGLQRIGRALAAPALAEGSGPIGSGPNYTGIPVTPDRALGLTACYCAINVLSRDLASLPLDVHRLNPDGSTRPAVEDATRRKMLRLTPSGDTTAFRFRQSLIAHALAYGNGYAEIERSRSDGSPLALHLLDPKKTRATRSSTTGVLWYEQARGVAIPGEDVIHFAPLGFDGLTGYSPIKLCQQSFGLGLALESYGASFFGNGARTSGVIKIPKRLTPEGATRLREGWEHLHQGPGNAHRTAVLEEGADYVPFSIPPDEAQFIASRGFQVLEVARLYGMPPHKLGDWSQAHLASVEQGNLDYIATTLMPWCEGMENEWDLKLFLDRERDEGLYVAHDMAALLRGDMAARGTWYDTLLKWGVVTPNLIASKEGLPGIGPAGDVHLMQLNMTTLESVGAPKPQTVSPSGVIADAEPEEEAPAPEVEADPVAPEVPADVQATALNGAQVTSLLQIITAVTAKTLPPESAKAMLTGAFPSFTALQINAMVDSAAAFVPPAEDEGPAPEEAPAQPAPATNGVLHP